MAEDPVASSLARIADTPRLLVALDFDGTLAPLVDEPMSARMTPETRAGVDALAALPDTTVAFVSGRTLADLRVIAEHDDDAPFLLSGSHGAEFWEPGTGVVPADAPAEEIELRDRLRALAEDAIAGLDGTWIEPKAFGFALHTRTADADTAAAARRAVDALARENAPGWRRRQGNGILEFAFRHEGKDSAVRALRERTGASAVLFAGDDVTDEDALRDLGESDLGVRVGAGETAAALTVRDVDEFGALLDALARMRASARQ